ncbi:ComEC/Rec2 family competence protein [Microbacterium dextranolyticum]|uniref:ComEC/Rec2 family competence protein n=1 Tax=Microbacterium dextranolyticum TaxID=36806 RepID=UPI001DD1117A|nr:ComEC/Rec2 family competence protein [Microbacterium dextranolyticum]MBM7462885.1 competence protein ComEC [Microbacterium dextranolyticum]
MAALMILAPACAGTVAVALWIAAVAALALALRAGTPHPRAAAALVAVVLAASAAAATQVAAAQPAREAAASLPVDGGRALVVEGVAVGKIERGGDGRRFDALMDVARLGTRADAEWEGTSIPVLVRASAVPAALDLGARVRVRGTAWRPDAGDRAVLVVDAAEVEVIDPPSGVFAVASALRRGLLDRAVGLPAPGGGLIAGLAVGDTSAVTPELDGAMKASSLSHLTAVSGANCALVVALAFGGAALCRVRRAVRVLVGLAALTGFVVLVSPEPSVVRAAAMAAIAMLGLLLGRPGAGLSLLTTAVVVLLIADPWLALSLGFALSTAATGALLVGAGPLADGMARWMPRPLALGISVPLAAQLACGPLIVLISPQVSLYGVLANVVAAPAAPVGTVLGLAACLAAGVPALGAGLTALAWLPAAWIAATATMISAVPGNAIPWPEGPGGLVVLAVVGAATAALIVRTRPLLRVSGAVFLTGAVVIVVGTGPVADIVERSRMPADWAIAACDIGQGDAVLIRSGGTVALVDTGPDPVALTRCLQQLSIDRIDLLVLTHFDHDHDGGTPAVVGRVDVVLHGPTAAPDDERTLRRLDEGGARLVRTVAGMSGALGDAHWRALWPQNGTPAGNDGSVVVEVTGGDVPSSLFLGDLSARGQKTMAARSSLRTSYVVVKVAHHGSADQDPGLYARISPAVALVSVGENTYGHPRPETLDMLTRLGARIDRTDEEGLVVLWADADALRIWHERTPP